MSETGAVPFPKLLALVAAIRARAEMEREVQEWVWGVQERTGQFANMSLSPKWEEYQRLLQAEREAIRAVES